MLLDVVVLVAGIVVLARASDLFVVGAARLAVIADVSPLVVGAIIVGFGTSAPELLVSVLAAVGGSPDIAVGNVVGSNLANLTLVLGAAGLLVQPEVTSRILRREAPLSLAAIVLFAVTVQGSFGRWEGVLLVAALVAAIAVMLRVTAASPEAPVHEEELEAECEERVELAGESTLADVIRAPTRREIVRTSIGLAGTILGAQLLVSAARSIAEEVGLSGGFVGVTLVAVGTSLPELVTAIQSARRGATALLLGNVLGSNMFNSLGVAGATALVASEAIDDPALTVIGVAAMVVVAALSSVFLAVGGSLRRWEAAVLLLVYLVTLPLLA